MKDKILKELTKMRRGLKKNEKESIYPLIDSIENMLDERFDISIQTICMIGEVLNSITTLTENVKVYKAIINILVIMLRNTQQIKSNKMLMPITAQLTLDRTMEALDIFIANLIDKIGGSNGYCKER